MLHYCDFTNWENHAVRNECLRSSQHRTEDPPSWPGNMEEWSRKGSCLHSLPVLEAHSTLHIYGPGTEWRSDGCYQVYSSWWVWAKGWCLEGLTAPHQQAVDSRGRRTPAEGPHSEAVVNLKTSIRDAQAEDRGPLWQLRPSSDTAENVSNHQAKQHLMSSSASVAEKPDQFFGRFEEGSAVTTIDPAPGTNNQALITQSADVSRSLRNNAGPRAGPQIVLR